MNRRSFVVAVGITTLAGCSSTPSDETNESNSKKQPESQLPESAPENSETIQTENLFEVSVTDIIEYQALTVATDNELIEIEPDNDVFVNTLFRVTNLSSEERKRIDRDTFALWSDGEVYDELTVLPGGYSFNRTRKQRFYRPDLDWEPVVGFEKLDGGSFQQYSMVFDVPVSDGYLIQWKPPERIEGIDAPVYIKKSE